MKLPIWDAPTRIVHWLLVLLVAAAWWTGKEEELDWHFRIGTAIVFLLVFRLAWGLVGSSTARFSGFVRGPASILVYLRGKSPPAIGHNPLGALSVLAMWGILLVHVGAGLLSSDEDGIAPAPLSHLVDSDVSEAAHDLHEQTFDILLVLIGLHLAATLFYALVRRKNLVGPMVTGIGVAPPGAGPMRPAPAWRLALALTVAFLAIWAVWSA